MSAAAVAERRPSTLPADVEHLQQHAQQQPPTTPPLDRLALTHALNNPTDTPITPGHILSSPYPAATHTLDLSRVPTPSALFARALTTLAPTDASYATAPYETAFDFAALFAELRALVAATPGFAWPRTSFYVVAFRSVLKEGIDKERLGLLDEKSHEEAVESGGLLKYWFGVPDGESRNLATCFWHSREDAAAGGKGPWHKKARGAAVTMYESIRFETRRLTVEEGVSGWKWEDWKHEH
ncbi:uncharacterized protein BKCO1_4000092 [Diplodia corticola]|uniref:Uncharacterized protein n=1 Tax=Diplodia corticola TaxID=236234 RepID=A0A1J9QV22_9PEZI|nr:uncharacterized protein BKCO1_4000092 [Diplodia corticola]OJD32241.1 hypothetical protein BKCO1_4000092 [Diplodia corticola]